MYLNSVAVKQSHADFVYRHGHMLCQAGFGDRRRTEAQQTPLNSSLIKKATQNEQINMEKARKLRLNRKVLMEGDLKAYKMLT